LLIFRRRIVNFCHCFALLSNHLHFEEYFSILWSVDKKGGGRRSLVAGRLWSMIVDLLTGAGAR
jgi:hypothetical protein